MLFVFSSMALFLYLGAGVATSTARVVEKFLPIQRNAERYLDGEIDLEEATDPVVNNIRVYVSLTSVKAICDVIVVTTTGKWIFDILMHTRGIFKSLFGCGLQAFSDGMRASFDFFIVSLSTCSIRMILEQFKGFVGMHKNAFSFMHLCFICNKIYFLIVALTCDFSRMVRLDLMKYWLECMGIVRAIAEGLNIDFVKYMARSLQKNILPMNQSIDLPRIEWQRVKDPDFIRIIELPLEDLLHGTQREEKVIRQIREIGQTGPKIKEETYPIIIEPGCPDRKEFRFIEVGHRDPVNIPADLVVRIQTKPHPIYERMGSDLIYRASISLEDVRIFEITDQSHLFSLGTQWCTTSSTINRWRRKGIECVQIG